MLSESALRNLILSLAANTEENEYIAFATHDNDPDDIGQRLSALSNMATIENAPHGYLLWGVEKQTHAIVGTDLSFSKWPDRKDSIEIYWKNLLSKTATLTLYEAQIEGRRVLLAEIAKAQFVPTAYKKTAYCRVNGNLRKLLDYPKIAKSLWGILSLQSEEGRIVKDHLSEDDVLSLLDVSSYYQSLRLPLPGIKRAPINAFLDEGFIKTEEDEYAITAIGALLFARDLSLFPSLSTKTIRLIRYGTSSRFSTIGRREWKAGYVISYQEVIRASLQFIAKPSISPRSNGNEQYFLPKPAVRELITNAIVHQDIGEGQGPLVEVFSDRIECSNAGPLLVKADRIIDAAPESRNKKMSAFFRRVEGEEASGSGFGTIAYVMETLHLPAPSIAETETGIRICLQWGKRFLTMVTEEKIQACYIHAVLCFLDRRPCTNSSLRERFGLGEDAKFQISRLIKSCVERGLIKPTENVGKKEASYLPYWAI